MPPQLTDVLIVCTGTTCLLLLTCESFHIPEFIRVSTHLVVFPNFTNKLHECLIYIDPLLRRCLDERAVEVLGKITTLCEQTCEVILDCWNIQ